MEDVSHDDPNALLPRSKTRARRSYIPGVSIDQIAYSLPISLLAFLSIIRYLAFFTLIIFMTIYRVTYPRAFFVYLTGNLLYDDVMIAALASVTCATLFYKNKRLLLYSVSSIVAPLGISVAINNLIPAEISALVSFPAILASYFLFRKRMKLDLGKRITRNSLVMTGAGILFIIELLSLIIWIIYPSYAPYWSKIFSPSPEWYIPGVEAQIFYASARLAPAIALVLSFSFLIRPGFNSVLQLLTGKSIVDTTDHAASDIISVSDTIPDNAGADHNKFFSPKTEPEKSNFLPSKSSTNLSSTIAEVAKTNEEKEGDDDRKHLTELPLPIQSAALNVAGRSKRLHPNLKARRKFVIGGSSKNRGRKLENKLSSSDKAENHLNELIATKTAARVKSTNRFWIFVSISLIVLFSLYPYLATLNENFAFISVDAHYYVDQINNINKNGVFSKDGPFSFSNERALSVLFFYGLGSILPISTNVFVAYLPIPLASFLALSGYLLIRYGRTLQDENETERSAQKASYFLVPLLIPFSAQFITGIYAGFFSNMLALSFMLLTLLFYLRFLRSSRMLNLGLFITMMFLTLFSHVYTWVFLLATLLISTAIILLSNRRAGRKVEKKPHIMVLVSIAITIAVLFSISSVIASKSGVSYLSDILSTNFGGDFFGTRWFNINNTFRFYLGGFLANSVMMGLALVWAFRADYKNYFNAVILASTFIFSAFFFLGDEVTQSRIFYNIPLFVPAAIALSNFRAGKYIPSLDSRTRTMIVVLIFLYLGNYALRSLANFYLVGSGVPFT